MTSNIGAGRLSSCEALGHDVEIFRSPDAQGYIYRHGPFRFGFPVLFPPNNGSLILAYERAFDDWLKVVHGSLVPDRR